MATIFAESGPNAVCFWRSWRLDNAKATPKNDSKVLVFNSSHFDSFYVVQKIGEF
jgi:hypothetical protein